MQRHDAFLFGQSARSSGTIIDARRIAARTVLVHAGGAVRRAKPVAVKGRLMPFQEVDRKWMVLRWWHLGRLLERYLRVDCLLWKYFSSPETLWVVIAVRHMLPEEMNESLYHKGN